MAVCPICGCKTEELDFVKRKLLETDCKVCSFCNRQLNVFQTDTQPTEAQIRWLDAVIGKEVPEREADILSALKSIRTRFPSKEIVQPAAPTQPKMPVVQKASASKVAEVYDGDEVIKDLQKRITALESEIRFMKRKQMIKTIIELGLPVVMLILLIIVFFASGVYDNFKTLFDMAGIAL